MLARLARDWWMMTLRGVVSIAFGILCWAMPGLTMTMLVIFFGVYAIADGLFALFTAARSRHEARSVWPFVVEGAVGLFAGAAVLAWPLVSMVVLFYLIAGWALASGVMELYAAVRLRKFIQDEFWLGLGGVASIALGLLMVLRPAVGLLAVTWMVGSYAIMFGALLIAFSLRLRSIARTSSPPSGADDQSHGAPSIGLHASHKPA